MPGEKNEALLLAVNSIGTDFHIFWEKNAELVEAAGTDFNDLFMAEELLRHLMERLWLIRHELREMAETLKIVHFPAGGTETGSV